MSTVAQCTRPLELDVTADVVKTHCAPRGAYFSTIYGNNCSFCGIFHLIKHVVFESLSSLMNLYVRAGGRFVHIGVNFLILI